MATDSARPGIATIGECMIELSGHGDGWKMGFAGDTLNTLWALHALCPDLISFRNCSRSATAF